MHKFRHYRYYFIPILLTASLLPFGCIKKISAEINGGTFSMSLPQGWIQNKSVRTLIPNSTNASFLNQEFCQFEVVIGFEADSFLKSRKEEWQMLFADAKSTEFKKWADYEGEGFEIEGKVEGDLPYRKRLFRFYKQGRVCVIVESASLENFNKYAADFKVMRQTFKLK